MQAHEINIAKNIRALEWLKAEMLDSLAALYKSLIKNGAEGIVNNIARLIVCCFLLAKRLGLSFGQVEQQVYHKVNEMLMEGNPLEDWHGDITLFKEYLDMKNRL